MKYKSFDNDIKELVNSGYTIQSIIYNNDADFAFVSAKKDNVLETILFQYEQNINFWSIKDVKRI